MVQVHAMLHSMDARPTMDADLLVDVLTHTHAVREVSDSLSRLGFSVQVAPFSGYTTRMRNGDFEVDLLEGNHLGKPLRERALLKGHPMLGLPGSRRAVMRSALVNLRYGERCATMCIPGLLGALLLKAAAFRERGGCGRERHLMDAALSASMIDRPEIELLRLNTRSRSDRKNVRTLVTWLLGPDAYEYAEYLTDEQIAQQRAVILEFSRLLEMPPQTWSHGGLCVSIGCLALTEYGSLAASMTSYWLAFCVTGYAGRTLMGRPVPYFLTGCHHLLRDGAAQVDLRENVCKHDDCVPFQSVFHQYL